MRVTIAAVGFLCVLTPAAAAFAADGAAPTAANTAASTEARTSNEARARAASVSICAEPARLFELTRSSAQAEALPNEDTSALWCVTPDDPRCSPLESGTSTSVSFEREKLGCALGFQVAAAAERPLVEQAPPERREDARNGVFARVERPPRA